MAASFTLLDKMRILGKVRDSSSAAGMAGVAVSNGEHMVRTGPDGSYQLPLEPGGHAFVWMVTPEGFRPANRFFRALSARTRTVDFELTAAPERRRRWFRLAHITDLHLAGKKKSPGWELTSAARLEKVLADLVGEAEPDLIAAGGDLTNYGSLEEMEAVHQVLAKVETPLFPLFGNHDGSQERRLQLAREGRADLTFTRHYERFFGPPYYSFDWGGRHFVLVMDFDRCFSPRDRQRKAAWLQADLRLQAPQREIIIVQHGPPSAQFLENLGSFNVRLLLYGHRHASKVFHHEEMAVMCTPPLCFGGADNTPCGYRLLDFSEAGAKSRLVAAQGAALRQPEVSEIALRKGRLQLVWKRRIPGGLHGAGPVLWGDAVLVSLRDEDLQGASGVQSLELATGKSRWTFRSGASIKNQVAVASEGWSAAVSVPGRVFLIETCSGRQVWSADMPGYPELFVYSAPLIANGAVYVAEKDACAAFSLAKGEKLWSRTLDKRDQGTPVFQRGVAGRDVPCYSSPLVYGDLLIVAVAGRGLLGMKLDSGEIAWEYEEAAVKSECATPVLKRNLLVSAGGANSLAVIDAGSGEPIWHKEVLEGQYPTGLAVAGERIYATTPTGGIRCCDLPSGEVYWSFATGADLLDMVPRRRGLNSILAPPVPWEEQVLVGGNDGHLYILDGASGECESRTDFGAPLVAPPCLTAEGLCIGTWDGRLYFFRRL